MREGEGEGEGEASHERASEASYKNLPNCRAQRKAEQIDKIEKWQTAPGGTGQPSGAAGLRGGAPGGGGGGGRGEERAQQMTDKLDRKYSLFREFHVSEIDWPPAGAPGERPRRDGATFKPSTRLVSGKAERSEDPPTQFVLIPQLKNLHVHIHIPPPPTSLPAQPLPTSPPLPTTAPLPPPDLPPTSPSPPASPPTAPPPPPIIYLPHITIKGE